MPTSADLLAMQERVANAKRNSKLAPTKAEMEAEFRKDFGYGSRVEMGPPPEVEDSPASESKLHEQIIEECDKRLWGYIHNRMDRKATTKKGIPDFVIVADQSRTFYIECKMPGKKFSDEQNKFKAVAERNGHTVHRVENMAQFAIAVGITWPPMI